jgi:murein DD-endopeptidase MepM/ murein hydrolase activator NlpD
MKKLVVVLLCLLVLSAFNRDSLRAGSSPTPIVSWEPASLVNGSPCLFRVTPSQPLKSLHGTWFGRKVFFDVDPASRTWYGVAGIDVDARPGRYTLDLTGVAMNGKRMSFDQVVSVGKANYPISKLRVPKKYTDLDAKTLARVKREQALKSEVFHRITDDRQWSGRFATPVKTATTAVFGAQRTFNGVRQSIHQGLDYQASTGTPVGAVNSGTVILARDLFFEGNCVVIDHGQGLLTLYLHLSAVKVKEGDTLTRGQIVGLSGATGRVTGPHLHLAVRWQGIYVNPATMLELPLP